MNDGIIMMQLNKVTLPFLVDPVVFCYALRDNTSTLSMFGETQTVFSVKRSRSQTSHRPSSASKELGVRQDTDHLQRQKNWEPDKTQTISLASTELGPDKIQTISLASTELGARQDTDYIFSVKRTGSQPDKTQIIFSVTGI